ncbi:MAG: LCP family protein [Patescibacteria group bacterium]|jgi:anionic cell wall polymer biosynthesis LytR-Cps2A-Psr (LCP) family protein
MSLHPKPKRKPVAKLATNPAPMPEPAKPRPSWKKRLWGWLWRFLLVFVLVLGLLLLGIYATQPRYYNVLIIGSDQRNTEHARSDVLMIASIPKSGNDKLSLTTVPRDTKIDHPEKGLQKITHFYAMWEDKNEYLGNHVLTQTVVEALLDIKINSSVEVTFESFDEIVNLVGGVDTSQGHLTGKQAEELVHNRFVQPNGDFGRTAAQREILADLLKKFKQPANARKLRDYFNTTKRARLTVNPVSAGLFGLAYLLGHFGQINLNNINEVVLPGESKRIYTPDFNKSLYYWILDMDKTNELVKQYLK